MLTRDSEPFLMEVYTVSREHQKYFWNVIVLTIDNFVIRSLGLSVCSVIFLTTVKRTSLLENKAIDTKPGTSH